MINLDSIFILNYQTRFKLQIYQKWYITCGGLAFAKRLKIMRYVQNPMKYYRYIALVMMLIPSLIYAAWETVTVTNIDNDLQTRVARIENSEGFSLEIYRDASGAVRSRLTMNSNYRLKEKSCPTYQVDNYNIGNRSINDAPCISYRQWAEFVLGYIIDNQVTSPQLHNIMNGGQITYRFILENSGYLETSFSLMGSKQALIEALGNKLQILTDNLSATD